MPALGRFSLPKLHVWAAVVLILLGVALLHAAHSALASDSTAHHLLRDIGIASFVSGTVTVLYEGYFRSRIDVTKIGSVVNAVYGSYVPEHVWGNIRDTLTKRDVIRNDTQIRLKLTPAPHGWLGLEIEQTYKLVGLHHRQKEVTVLHEVDQDMAPVDEKPRFEYINLDAESFPIVSSSASKYSLADGRIELDGPTLKLRVTVQPLQSVIPLNIRVVRKEYRQVPGLYYLVQPELTDGITVYLDECPPAVFVDLTVRPPQQRNYILSKASPMAMIKDIFLPGQCLEFKFHTRPPTATSS
jgi:hypothetical protein